MKKLLLGLIGLLFKLVVIFGQSKQIINIEELSFKAIVRIHKSVHLFTIQLKVASLLTGSVLKDS